MVAEDRAAEAVFIILIIRCLVQTYQLLLEQEALLEMVLLELTHLLTQVPQMQIYN